jgi:hypothetical protein
MRHPFHHLVDLLGLAKDDEFQFNFAVHAATCSPSKSLRWKRGLGEHWGGGGSPSPAICASSAGLHRPLACDPVLNFLDLAAFVSN